MYPENFSHPEPVVSWISRKVETHLLSHLLRCFGLSFRMRFVFQHDHEPNQCLTVRTLPTRGAQSCA